MVAYQTMGKALRAFALFLFLSGLIQGISLIFWFFSTNNFFLLHIYTALGFCSLAWFYRIMLKGFINSRIIDFIIIGFLIFTVINSIYFQGLLTFNSNALVIESILIIIFSISTYILFLDNIVKGQHKESLASFNWINSGLFIYHLSSLVIFYFGDYFTRNFPAYINRYTWVLHSFFSVVMYIFFYIGLWKRHKA